MLASKQQPYDARRAERARRRLHREAFRHAAADREDQTPRGSAPRSRTGASSSSCRGSHHPTWPRRSAPRAHGCPPGRPMPAPSGLSLRPPAVNAAPSAPVPVGRGTLAYGRWPLRPTLPRHRLPRRPALPSWGLSHEAASGAAGTGTGTGTGAQSPYTAPQPAPPSVLASVATAAVANGGPLANQLADLGLTAVQKPMPSSPFHATSSRRSYGRWSRCWPKPMIREEISAGSPLPSG